MHTHVYRYVHIHVHRYVHTHVHTKHEVGLRTKSCDDDTGDRSEVWLPGSVDARAKGWPRRCSETARCCNMWPRERGPLRVADVDVEADGCTGALAVRATAASGEWGDDKARLRLALLDKADDEEEEE